MKKIIIILLILGMAFSSCEKYPDNITVLLDNSGTATINVVDNSGINIKGANVSVASYNIEGGYGIIYRDSTNINGICNLGKVIQGEYQCFVSAVKENKKYSYSKYFQIIAGENKTIVANPFENIGNLKIKVINMYYEPVINVNAALIPHPRFSNVEYFFENLMDEAYFLGQTDSQGIIKFQNVPVGIEYSLLVYTSNDNYSYPGSDNYFYVDKGKENTYSLEVRLPNSY